MPVTVKSLKGRLNSCQSVLKLREHDKIHIFELLKCLDKSQGGITVSELKKKYLGTGKPLHFSNTYLIAYLDWLKGKDYITSGKGKKLTDSGKRAFFELHDFLSPPRTSLDFSWDTNQRANRVRFDGKIDDLTRTVIYSNDYFRNLVIELSAYLCALPNVVDLTITVEPVGPNTLNFLKFLWGFYYNVVTDFEVNVNPFGVLFLKTDLTDNKSKQKYFRYWRNHYENYLKFKDEPSEEIITFEGVPQKIPPLSLYPLIPHELDIMLPVYLNDDEIRRLLEVQFEKDPDWFMPHPVWVELGFEPKRKDLSVDSIAHVAPPFFHTLSMQGLPNGFAEFESILRFVGRRDETGSIDAFALWLIRDANCNSSDFYRCWQILRHTVEGSNQASAVARFAPLLDEALVKFISSEKKPVLDLKAVFSSYYATKSTEKVLEQIEQGLFLL